MATFYAQSNMTLVKSIELVEQRDRLNAFIEKRAGVARMTLQTLVKRIWQRPDAVRVYTQEGVPAAVVELLKGIVEWLTDEPTISAGIVEDLARAMAKCGSDREALRDFSVQVRNLALSYQPDPGRVAVTEAESALLDVIKGGVRF